MINFACRSPATPSGLQLLVSQSEELNDGVPVAGCRGYSEVPIRKQLSQRRSLDAIWMPCIDLAATYHNTLGREVSPAMVMGPP